MVEVNKKAVIIEGDKSGFFSKSSIDKFKNDIKSGKTVNPKNYLYDGWVYSIVSTTDNEIKVSLENKNAPKQVKKADDQTRQMLRMKIKEMEKSRLAPSQIKTAMRDKVPEDLLGAYMTVKKFNQIKVPIPSPDQVLSKPDEFKPVVQAAIQSFGMFRGTTNPIVNYYKLLAKHLDLPTYYIPPTPQENEPVNPFLAQLRQQREQDISVEVDDEMKKIYESLGIEPPKSEQEKQNEEIDDEMKKIYESLGVQMEGQ